jgi:hypothetical protein
MKQGMQSEWCVGALLLFGAGLWACPAGDVDTKPSSVTASAPASAAGARVGASVTSPPASAGASGAPRKGPLAPPPWHIPVGPTLPILPGQGLGPIRFGATQETIERLIGEPCEERRQEPSGVVVCRYSAQAVEFLLDGGVIKEIHAHRLGRPFKPGTKVDFGIFNGHFESGAGFGMLEAGVRELLGKPKAERKLDRPEAENPNLTVLVHEYDGFTLEYDRIGPERVVLGGVILKAPK